MAGSDLEELISERDRIRKKEKDLTDSIKSERQRLAAEREKSKRSSAMANVTATEWRKLKSENAKLRGLVAVLLKDSGVTYKMVGDKLNCGPSRAKEIVVRAVGNLTDTLWSEKDG
jgi:ribosomal protein L32E